MVGRPLLFRFAWLLSLMVALAPLSAASGDEQTPASTPSVPTLSSGVYSDKVTTLEIGDDPVTFRALERLTDQLDSRADESATPLVLSLAPLWVDYELSDLASRALDHTAPWQSLARASAPTTTFASGLAAVIGRQLDPPAPVPSAPLLPPHFYGGWR